MIKKIFLTLSLFTLLITYSYSAGSSNDNSSKVKSDYDKAVTLIKSAKKYEKKTAFRNNFILNWIRKEDLSGSGSDHMNIVMLEVSYL